MAWLGGPDVFRGKRFWDLATARYARMAIEGARWQGVAGIGQFLYPPTADCLKATAPQAVFVRQYNSCFYPGGTMSRTVAVFNEGRTPRDLTLKWKLVFAAREVAGGEKTYHVAAGTHAEDTLRVALPKASSRVDGTLQLVLYAQGREVFDDAKPVSLLPRPSVPADLDAATLCVFDPAGPLLSWLREHRQAFTKLDSLESIPATCQVVLAGPGSLPEGEVDRAKAAGALRRLVAAGKAAVVLEQTVPLQKDELPVPGIMTFAEQKQKPSMMEYLRREWKSGAICHPVAAAHPVLAGLKPDDFLTWAGPAETNFRFSYATPAAGSVNLIQAGTDLGLTPMMEVPVGSGSYLLSQVLVGERLGVEPAADRLMANILQWAAGRKNVRPGKTTLYAAGDSAFREFVGSLGVELTPADSPGAALAGDPRVAVIRATPESLQWLAEHAAQAKAFCETGRWLMLAGLEGRGLSAFNSLVGVEHRLRPFRPERVTLDSSRRCALCWASRTANSHSTARR